MNKPYIVAEAGCNHQGSRDLALKMIDKAVKCKADIIKFQKREPELAVNPFLKHQPHPDPSNAFGKTYLEHRIKLELPIEYHFFLKEYCKKKNILYACSVWDIESAKQIIDLEPYYLKIPSAVNTNKKLLEFVCENYKGEIHISLGMTKKSEERKIIKILDKYGVLSQTVLYACTSGYPVGLEHVYLYEIIRLKSSYKVKTVGYSGHHKGILVDIAAYLLGAEFIERHFTLDKNMKGRDHKCSLEPYELKELVESFRKLNKALKYKKQLPQIELKERERQKWIRDL